MASPDVEVSLWTNKSEKTRNFCETSPAAEDCEGNPSKRARTMQLGGNLEVPDDGQGWLKYGQKLIRGTNHQRNYYRCSLFKTLGCPAKKTVDFRKTNPSELRITDSHGHNHPCRSQLSIDNAVTTNISNDNVITNRVSLGGGADNHRIPTGNGVDDRVSAENARKQQSLKEKSTRNLDSTENWTENSLSMERGPENLGEISSSTLNFESRLRGHFRSHSQTSIGNGEILSSEVNNNSPPNSNLPTPKASNSLPKSSNSSLNGDSYSGKTTVSPLKFEIFPLNSTVRALDHRNLLDSNSSEDCSTEKLQKSDIFEPMKPGRSQSFGENLSWSSGTVNGGQQDESSPTVLPDTEEAISGSCNIGRKLTISELRLWGQSLQLGLAGGSLP